MNLRQQLLIPMGLGILATVLAIISLALTAVVVFGHTASSTCGGFIILSDNQADIYRVQQGPDPLVYDNVKNGSFAVTPGTYFVDFANGSQYDKTLVVSACPTPTPSPTREATPSPTPTSTPSPSPTQSATPTPSNTATASPSSSVAPTAGSPSPTATPALPNTSTETIFGDRTQGELLLIGLGLFVILMVVGLALGRVRRLY